MSDFFQVHLTGKLHGGRGIRFRLLSAAEHTQVSLDAGTMAGEKGTALEWSKIEGRIGAKRMLIAVTTKPVKDLASAEWMDVTEQLLDAKFDEMFSAKDANAIIGLYRTYHQISETDLDDIMGKVSAVTSGD